MKITEQMTIFELVGRKEVPWQELSEQELADRIAGHFGAITKKDFFKGYCFFKNGYEIRIRKGRYVRSVHNGAEMISVDITRRLQEGYGAPCDSIEEAVEIIKNILKRKEV